MTESEAALQKMQVISWIVLAVMVTAAAIFVSWWFAVSVLAGGVVSIVSFWVSSTDVLRMIGLIVARSSLEDRKTQAQQGQKGYLLKFWIRIVLIGIVLLLLIKSKVVNIFGLILGLSTVVVAITFISLNMARHYFFRGRR